MHPAKIAEKDWQDSYKLSRLIRLQAGVHAQGQQLFGGINAITLCDAFAEKKDRSISRARARSPHVKSTYHSQLSRTKLSEKFTKSC